MQVTSLILEILQSRHGEDYRELGEKGLYQLPNSIALRPLSCRESEMAEKQAAIL